MARAFHVISILGNSLVTASSVSVSLCPTASSLDQKQLHLAIEIDVLLFAWPQFPHPTELLSPKRQLYMPHEVKGSPAYMGSQRRFFKAIA